MLGVEPAVVGAAEAAEAPALDHGRVLLGREVVFAVRWVLAAKLLAVRRASPPIPITICKDTDAGAVAYLTKPFSETAILDVINAALEIGSSRLLCDPAECGSRPGAE